MKPGIHFHSDCPFFAGCENLLANLFQDDRFMESHGVSFSYRHSHTYESGFRRRVTKQFNVIPLKLFDVSSISTYANSLSFRPGRIMIKAAAVLLLVKYWFLLWNALVLWRGIFCVIHPLLTLYYWLVRILTLHPPLVLIRFTIVGDLV